MITSRLFRADHPRRVLLSLSGPEGKQTGLLSDSAVMTDNLTTVFLEAIERKIGSIPMDKVDLALKHTLHLS